MPLRTPSIDRGGFSIFFWLSLFSLGLDLTGEILGEGLGAGSILISTSNSFLKF